MNPRHIFQFALAVCLLLPVATAGAAPYGNQRSGGAQPKMLKPPVARQPMQRPSTRMAPRGPSLTRSQELDLRARLRTLDAEYRRRLKTDGKANADIWLRARQQQYRQDAPGR